ncbi:MAG: hypothetical protein ABSB76_10400 [Streptosporangiaceae bacterium]
MSLIPAASPTPMPCHQPPSRRRSRSAPISAARIRLTSPRCSVRATGQVSRVSAVSANQVSGRRRTPAAVSDCPHSAVSPTTLAAVMAILRKPIEVPAAIANTLAANGG